VLDPELRQRPADLGRLLLRHLAARLGRHEVVAAAVGVERAEQAVAPDRLGQAQKARDRALLLDQKGRVDLVVGIVHRDDQVARRRLGEPCVA